MPVFRDNVVYLFRNKCEPRYIFVNPKQAFKHRASIQHFKCGGGPRKNVSVLLDKLNRLFKFKLRYFRKVVPFFLIGGINNPCHPLEPFSPPLAERAAPIDQEYRFFRRCCGFFIYRHVSSLFSKV